MKFVKPLTGSGREIRKFAIFPICVNGIVYWLEWIKIHQSYNTRNSGWSNDWIVH